ncbi:MAG: mannitol operon transcriptional activator [Chloroflexota bacterium]|nr:mannitol operon transcriptional activator [Chloroflexota bacterium]
MVSLTTRQRDILRILLHTDKPIRTADLAEEIHLTARQVNYSMRGVRTWLKQENVALQTTPGLGVALECLPEKKTSLVIELEKSDNVQLVLTPEQRQQLICFLLLIESEPVILTRIGLHLKISRSTVISDLDQVEAWLADWDIRLERKQNYGISIICTEKQRQQVLLSLIWGKSPFSPSVFEVSYQKGLIFSLAEDIHSTPLVKDIDDFLHLFDMKRIFNKVIYIEDSLGGRFTDEAVLYLALVFSVLLARMKMGEHIRVEPAELAKFKDTQEWRAAERMVTNLDSYEAPLWDQGDIAYVVMHIYSSPLLENWVSDLERVDGYKPLFEELLVTINSLYQIDGLTEDPTLREGIINYLVPVFNQHAYGLWFPKANVDLSSIDECEAEYALVDRLADIIHKRTTIALEDEDKDMLVAFLRAAYIRLRSYQFSNVLLVCPSGMATAQLLTARLKTRFPHLGKLTVVSFRELDAEKVATADLIITLMPLAEDFGKDKPIIQVSPQLLQCDIDAITAFLG